MNNSLTSKVEVSIACKNLCNKDVMSKSDPMGVLYMKHGGQTEFIEVGRTEMILNNLSPNFAKKFDLDYYFEEQQKLRFDLYDVDSASKRLEKHDFLGRFEITLGELVSRASVDAKLVGVKGSGSIQLSCTEVSGCKELLTIQLDGHKLDKKDLFGKSDPFVEIFRAEQVAPFQDGVHPPAHLKFTLVHRTEVIKNTLNPAWQPFIIQARRLCAGDRDRYLRFDVYDWDSDGGDSSHSSHDVIGTFYSSMNQLVTQAVDNPNHAYEVINEKKKKKKRDYRNSGTLTLKRCEVTIENSFVDYISGGTELNFTVAIDFTASNGNPTNPVSLHYIDPSPYPKPNQYETAIKSVGEIIQDYDNDKQFPTLGFGAKIPPNQEVSHCFPLTFQPNNPFCAGVDGILATYKQAIRSVQLYGPTNFTPVLRHIEQFAKQHTDGSHYFVLLIITDGIISDMQHTVNAVIDASKLPVSVIIVGVGKEDFSAMDVLDCDTGRLQSQGKIADRDIVQFVPIRDFMSRGNDSMCQAALAKAVLAELPDQLTQWMRRRSINPLPRRHQTYPAGNQGQTQHSGQTPYPGGNQAPPYPGGNQPAPYPGGNQPAPYPGGNQPAPYPGGNQPAPYPGGNQPAPYPGGNQPSPYPGGNQPAPYPGGNQPAPYPGGNQARPHSGGGNQASPYPGGNQAAPYPGEQQPAPYPGDNQARPHSGGNQASPYPGGNQAAPYPGGNQAAPYPSGNQAAPYSGGDPGQRQSSKPSAPPPP